MELSKAQDIEAGDGTTSVVVLAGSLLREAEQLLNKGVCLCPSWPRWTAFVLSAPAPRSAAHAPGWPGARLGIHPTQISEGFQYATVRAVECLEEISQKVDLRDREALLKSATTSLNSKVAGSLHAFPDRQPRQLVGAETNIATRSLAGRRTGGRTGGGAQVVSQYSSVLAPIAVDAVLHVVDADQVDTNVDLNNIRIVKKVGGTIDDSELSNGLILTQNVITSASGPTRIEKAKIGLIQFQLSPPKADVRRPDGST